MRRVRAFSFFMSIFGILTAGFLLVAASEKEQPGPHRFKAVNVQAKTARANPATQIDIMVDRYTTDQERQDYVEILKEQGPDALILNKAAQTSYHLKT